MPPRIDIHDPHALPLHAYTGRKLGTAVLVYVLCVIGIITLEPFTFVLPSAVKVMYWDGYNWLDPIANVVLFLPLGFLYALTRSATDGDRADAHRRTLRHATLLGMLASTGIELTQVFEPSRYPSPVDVATNTMGAALGAWLFRRAASRLRADSRLVGTLALELPLMGLVYLLVPLCALAALTVRGGAVEPSALLPLPRGWGLVALALFGGTLLGHVQRRHLGPARATTPRQAAAVAAGWFVAGALPALATAPGTLAIGTAAAALACWGYGVAPENVVPINRRFERSTLARATPWLVAYLTLIPLTASGADVSLGRIDLLHEVESLAAYTVLGYVLAEAWGRLELRYRHTVGRVGLVALGAALVDDALRHVALPSLASAPSVTAHMVAAAYGGWIYHLQRAHVRALTEVSAAAPTSGSTPAAVAQRRRRPA